MGKSGHAGWYKHSAGVTLLHADTEPPQASRAADFVPADKLDRILHILAERALQETGATSVAIGLIRDGGVTCRAIAGLPIIDIGEDKGRPAPSDFYDWEHGYFRGYEGRREVHWPPSGPPVRP